MKERPIETFEELMEKACKVINEMVVTSNQDERYDLAMEFRTALRAFTEGAMP